MKKKNPRSRRDFLKATAVGAAGISTLGQRIVEAASSGAMATPESNPQISNLKVVCCHDPKMVNKKAADIDFGTGSKKLSSMKNQNAAVNTSVVEANLDAMAMELAKKQTPGDAWKTIFRKPSAKKWTNVIAAIKVNAISVNHPRLAIVAKMCKELHALGVAYNNISIYDGCHDAGPLYSSFVGKELPAGVKVGSKNATVGGSMINTPVPAPFNTKCKCTKHIADGTVDILINCAVNKGHGKSNGGFTLTMKNHFGTFTPKPKNRSGKTIHGGIDYIVSISKSNALIGGNPCRQQLCIIDSLWARNDGPSGAPNKDTNQIVMGTFSPAVDYATVRHIREKIMKASSVHDQGKLKNLPAAFGYTKAQFDAIDWVEVPPASGLPSTPDPQPQAPDFSKPHLKLAFGGVAEGWHDGDPFVQGGAAFTFSGDPDVSGVTDPAPAAVYKSVMHRASTDNVTIALPGVPDGTYTLRFHVADSFGGRAMDIAAEGEKVVEDLDPITAAGGEMKAVVKEATVAVSDGNGLQIVLSDDRAEPKDVFLGGLEIISGAATPLARPLIGSRAISATGGIRFDAAGRIRRAGRRPRGISLSPAGKRRVRRR